MEKNFYKDIKVSNVIGKIYDNWLTKDFLNHSFRDYNSFHPSDLGTCPRKAYRMSIKFPGHFYISPKQQRTFQNGHGMHERYQNHLGEIGILRGRWRCFNCNHIMGKENSHGIKKPKNCTNCNSPKKTKAVKNDEGLILREETPMFEYLELPIISEEYDIHGHTDGIIDINNVKFIIDFKTCSSSVFGMLNESNLPIKYHVRQVHYYMFILNINYASILYENKNTMEIKEFFLKRNEEIIEDIKKRAQSCIEARKTGIHPEIPEELRDLLVDESIKERYNQISFTCKGYPGYPACPFFYDCHSEVFEKMGGKNLYFAKNYNGEVEKFIEVGRIVEEK